MLNVDIVRFKNLSELWKGIAAVQRPRRYFAGGTDLVVLAKAGIGVPCTWVDLTPLKELKRIYEDKEAIFLGAGLSLLELEESDLVRRWAPALSDVFPEFAGPPIRGSATLGGNCANASPAGDSLPALYAEEARVVLERFGKRRELPIENFILGPRKTALRPDELLLGFSVPKRPHKGAFLKLGPRKGLAIAKASVAAAVVLEDGLVKKLRVALGAAGPTVIRSRRVEALLEGRALSSANIERARALAGEEARPITDHRSSAEYRRAMCGVLLGRILERFSRC
ncbi:MAG: hypothetical protein A3G41_07890 [Elusimicrobia bacterium RIFCSPLOWO2_12_FULL_59_9]|nr:MAG: hypothetical protein A3G41_07890 [Elusimicrobia bacterium RIFCSPLOWO2_12_FULL_59_9]